MRRPSRRCARTSWRSGCRPAEAKAKAKGKKAARRKIKKITDLAGRKVGVIGRSQSNVNLLQVILQQYGVRSDKVEIVQFAATEVNEAIRSHKADAFIAVGPVNSQITTDAIAATMRDGGTPTFLPIDLADSIEQNYPVYDATEIAAGAFGGAPGAAGGERQDDQLRHHIVARKSAVGQRQSRPSRGSCSRCARR